MRSLVRLALVALIFVAGFCNSVAKNSSVELSKQLQKRLERYRGDIGVLQQQVENLKKKLESSKGQSSLTISQLQEGMADERDILNTIEGYLSLPFNVTRCQCYDLSDSERQAVGKEIRVIKEKLARLESSSELSQSCPELIEVHKELLRERRYIVGVQQTLMARTECGQRPLKQAKVENSSGLVDLAHSEYQTNLKAKGWCYGKLTPEQVKLLWFAYTVKNNVTNCPLDTPYYDGQRCIACEYPTSFFDLSNRKCINALAVDKNRQCVGLGEAGLEKKAEEDEKKKQEEMRKQEEKKKSQEEENQKQREKEQRETKKPFKGPTYQEVEVQPLQSEPIVKSVTLHKEKKTIQKVVEPLEGKAVLNREKTTVNINYEQVSPEVSEPRVKTYKVRKMKQSSSNTTTTKLTASTSQKTSEQTTNSSSANLNSRVQPHRELWQF